MQLQPLNVSVPAHNEQQDHVPPGTALPAPDSQLSGKRLPCLSAQDPEAPPCDTKAWSIGEFHGPADLREHLNRFVRGAFMPGFTRSRLNLIVSPFSLASDSSANPTKPFAHPAAIQERNSKNQGLKEFDRIIDELHHRYHNGFGSANSQLGRVASDTLWDRLAAISGASNGIAARYLPVEDAIQIDPFTTAAWVFDPRIAIMQKLPDLTDLFRHEGLHFEFGNLNYRLAQRFLAQRLNDTSAPADMMFLEELGRTDYSINRKLNITIVEEALAYSLCGSPQDFSRDFLLPHLFARFQELDPRNLELFGLKFSMSRKFDCEETIRTVGAVMLSNPEIMTLATRAEMALYNVRQMLNQWGSENTIDLVKGLLARAWEEKQDAISLMLNDSPRTKLVVVA